MSRENKNEEIVASEWFRTRTGCLLRANHDVVAHSDKELGQTHMVKIRIDTGDQTLIKLKPYRTPIHKRPLVEEPVQNMLKAGMIKTSESPWSFPILVVDKKDSGHRFCVDFRRLNTFPNHLACH